MQINEKALDYKQQDIYGYNDIPIFAEKGVHEGVFLEFLRLNLDKNSKILILGSGAGAFDQRVLDAGYKNILAIDIELSFYKAQNIHTQNRNLNNDFSDLGEFDVIFAIEIIEHLENQFNFIQNISVCLKNTTGRLFLTTPNVDGSFSRTLFFFTGSINSFSESSLRTLGHIQPIFDHLFLFNIDTHGLYLEKKIGLSMLAINTTGLRPFLGSIFYKIIGLLIGGGAHLVNFYIIRKA